MNDVLDASAMFAYLKAEPGGDVDDLVVESMSCQCRPRTSPRRRQRLERYSRPRTVLDKLDWLCKQGQGFESP